MLICNTCKNLGHRMIIAIDPYIDPQTKTIKNRLFNYHSGTRHWHLDLLDRGHDFDSDTKSDLTDAKTK